MSGALATATTMHHQHTPEIEITGPDTATGTWAMQDIVHIGTFVLRGCGHYAEEYVRTSEGWKIESSTLTRVRVDTEGEPPQRGEIMPSWLSTVKISSATDSGTVNGWVAVISSRCSAMSSAVASLAESATQPAPRPMKTRA